MLLCHAWHGSWTKAPVVSPVAHYEALLLCLASAPSDSRPRSCRQCFQVAICLGLLKVNIRRQPTTTDDNLACAPTPTYHACGFNSLALDAH